MQTQGVEASFARMLRQALRQHPAAQRSGQDVFAYQETAPRLLIGEGCPTIPEMRPRRTNGSGGVMPDAQGSPPGRARGETLQLHTKVL